MPHMQRWREPREPGHRPSGQAHAHGPARLSALVYPLKVCKLARHWPWMPCPGLCQELLHIPRCSLGHSGDTHQLACRSSTISTPCSYVHVCHTQHLAEALTRGMCTLDKEYMALMRLEGTKCSGMHAGKYRDDCQLSLAWKAPSAAALAAASTDDGPACAQGAGDGSPLTPGSCKPY